MLPFHGLHRGLQLVDLFAHVVDGVVGVMRCNENVEICVLALGPLLRLLLLVLGQYGTHETTAWFVAHELAEAGRHAIETPAGLATKACELLWATDWNSYSHPENSGLDPGGQGS